RSTTLSRGPARRSRAFLGVLLQGASAMPHNSRLPRDVCSALLVLLVLCCVVAGRARADGRGAGSNAKSKAASLLREPVAFRVYQRDRNGRADIAVALDPGARGATLVSARLSGLPGDASIPLAGGKFAGVPTGGPYRLSVTVKVGNAERTD